MWPSKRTAIVIIHGIGQQSPFETLDPFVQSFWNVLETQHPGRTVTGSHRVAKRDDWVENYVSLSLEGSDISLDFYEYYWAYQMEREISFPEIVEWLVRTSEGARDFYDDNRALAAKYEGQGPFSDGRFAERWYLKQFGWPLRIVSLLYPLVDLSAIPVIGKLVHALSTKAGGVIVDYIGDIAIYTTTDEKSKHYAVRRRILDALVGQLKLLLPAYDSVVLAGHSLGSVIAFDALNRVNVHMNAGLMDHHFSDRIAGLVTFGSPLDKIAFFFRERTLKQYWIRRQVLSHFHGYRHRDLDLDDSGRPLSNPIAPLLDAGSKWINFWDPHDHVSGPLDFYAVDENIQYDHGQTQLDRAHGAYFANPQMFEHIIRTFF